MQRGGWVWEDDEYTVLACVADAVYYIYVVLVCCGVQGGEADVTLVGRGTARNGEKLRIAEGRFKLK